MEPLHRPPAGLRPITLPLQGEPRVAHLPQGPLEGDEGELLGGGGRTARFVGGPMAKVANREEKEEEEREGEEEG